MEKNRKMVIIGFIVLIIVTSISSFAVYYKQNYGDQTYAIGDYGVSIKIPKKFVKFANKNVSQLLNLQTKEITISATQLRGDFWESGDVNAINDEYIKLLSSAMFDRSVLEVEKDTMYIDREYVGKVSLVLSKNINIKKTITLLIPKSHGYLAIEFYGNKEAVEKNTNQINSMIRSIKFSENKHDYAKDIPKEATPEEMAKALVQISNMMQLFESGEMNVSSGESEE